MQDQKENNISSSPNDTYKQFSESICNLLKEARRYAASEIKKEIELLQEYRIALIGKVVTGKIKVI